MPDLKTIQSEKKSPSFFDRLFSWSFLVDLFFVFCIIAVGWFLIGYYTQYEFLETGYQDWIYHAFRVQHIENYGISSWDHIWNNGLNHWRAYQYVQHFTVYILSHFLGLSITQTMLWLSVCIFIAIRIFSYVSLRLLGIGRFFSFFAVIISYEFSQQYISMMDFSIHIGFIFISFYFLLWVFALKDRGFRFIYLLAAFAGMSWSIHSVIGYSFFGMFILLLIVNNLKRNLWKLGLSLAVFFISFLPFLVPYLLSGYSLSNPIFSTQQFLKDIVISEYFGLSLFYFILIWFSWAIFIMRSRQSPRWARMLLFYCTFYLVFIYFGLLGYYPEFVNKFQFSRAIPLIGFLLLFCFAAFLHTVFVSVRSRFIFTVIVVLIAVSISQSISTVSLFSGWPATSLADPVSDYFSDKQELREGGSIYFKNFSESSYLGDSNFRFVNSYNQHLMPNPYPVRFDRLMKTDISYTGVTDRQIELINDYSLVLGVEYLFVPLLSPLVDGLTVEREGDFVPALFEKVSEVGGVGDVFAVLRNRQPIANAYVFDEGRVEEYFRLDDFPKPTLKVSSYVVWDEEIQRVASFIRDESILPIELSFVWPDGLVVDTSTFSQFENPGVLINQSFDNGWSVENMNHVSIEPTSLRFMHLSFSGEVNDSEVVLKNSWPWWHWPVQSLGIVMVFLTTSALVFSFIRRRRLVRHQSE